MRNKLISLAALLLAALCISSCGDRIATVDSTVIKTVMIDVPQSTWCYSNQADNNYFFAKVNMPELTSAVCRQALIKVYRVYESTDELQIELPYIRHHEYLNDEGKWGNYTDTVDYEFYPGYINIVYTMNDFDYELNPSFVPEAMQFRCVIIY